MSSKSDPESEALVRKILLAIMCLRSKAVNGKISWRLISKEIHGSEEFAAMFSSIASMEPWKKYFVSNDKDVKLTQEGFNFAASIPPPTLSTMEHVADCVRQYAARLRNITLNVKSITRVAQVGQRYVQAFVVEASDEPIPSETPCEFRPNDGSSLTYGRIIGQEPDGGVIYIALDSEVSDASLPAVLSIDRAYLLTQLAVRIRELKEMPELMCAALRPSSAPEVSIIADSDSLIVAEELSNLSTPWARFLWGPPGAGKTFGLGRLVARLLEKEPASKTLIVAPSNRAVDVAMEQVVKHIMRSARSEAVSNRELLRFGYPRAQSILDRAELLGSEALDDLSGKARVLSARIQRAERDRNNLQEIAVLRTEMLAAQEAVKNAVEIHIGGCRVVATTVTLAYLSSSPIAKFRWDNVIVDEVTMVTPAMCTYLASLAAQRFLMAGDPQQLGPVYESGKTATEASDYEWMGRDIFEKSRVSRGSGLSRRVVHDARLARISAQRRCTADIWTKVEHLYAEVQNLADEHQRAHLLLLPPSSRHSVVLADTSQSSQFSRCQKEYGSWRNQFTAELAMEIATTIAAESMQCISIAIIAPYRAQVRLLRKWIRLEQRALRSPLSRIEIDAGTVHQFQGSDADVILFDMVDGRGRKTIGQLLRGDAGLRMVNVAFTRAKGKLILIADRSWCMTALQAESNPLLKDMVSGNSDVATIAVLPQPELSSEWLQSFGCSEEKQLAEALNYGFDLPEVVKGYVLAAADGTCLAQADLAYPDAKIAIFVDGQHSNIIGDKWQRGSRQRSAFADHGWNFAVFGTAEIRDDVERCADEVAELYSRCKDNFKMR